jgi:hypothetical protein
MAIPGTCDPAVFGYLADGRPGSTQRTFATEKPFVFSVLILLRNLSFATPRWVVLRRSAYGPRCGDCGHSARPVLSAEMDMRALGEQ